VRLFLDANILFSAAYRDGSPALLLFDLAIAGRCQVVTSEFAWDEAYRNIRLEHPRRLHALEALRGRLESVPAPSPAATANALQHGLPDKDAPILAAAGFAGVDILVTGDRTHFGQLYGRDLGGLRVLTLRDTLECLLESD